MEFAAKVLAESRWLIAESPVLVLYSAFE